MLRRTAPKAIPRLYTSYYQGQLHPAQLRHGTPKGQAGFRSQLKSTLRKDAPVAPAGASTKTMTSSESEEPQWSDADAVDVVAKNESADKNVSTERALPARAYVPLGDFAQLELRADYLVEAGQPEAALRYYGVVAKGYNISLEQRPNHANLARIHTKLGRVFRLTDRLESSQHNLDKALEIVEGSTSPSLEIICEALMELGQTLEAQGKDTAGPVYEDVAHMLALYHNIGDSHRFLKNINKLCRDFIINQDLKFQYFSPFDNDRCFALADQALEYAERFYRKSENIDGVVRTLETRTSIMDQKLFSMNETAGKIRTMRGRHYRSMNILTNAPTAQEIFQYSPTVHQIYRDYSLELTAPLGREGEVMQGVNRRVVDDGSPRRRDRVFRGSAAASAAGSVEKYYQNMQWE